MIATFGLKLSKLSERWMPDPFVLALTLTLVTFVVALFAGSALADLPLPERVIALGEGWFSDFYGTGLMKFALQMCLVLITGHALAVTPIVRRLIERLANLVQTPNMAVVVVALVACLASLIQWGLGAIAGAFMAREMGRVFAREGRPVHYPLLGAAGYAGFMVWHGGLSGSAPLKVAEPGHFLESTIGVIPISETLFSTLNLTITGTLLVLIPFVFWALMPRDESKMVPFQGEFDAVESTPVAQEGRASAVSILEEGRYLNLLVTLGILVFLGNSVYQKGVGTWNLDTTNLLFLGLGLGFHKNPMSYVKAVSEGVKGCAGIILQFPFYFGILGFLKVSGLIVDVSEFFVSISNPTTYPILTFFSAGIVNFFVPSGGGQWAVQGPVMMQGLVDLGIPATKVIMALSYGDAWTNMLQPFWALPLLGIMGLKARDIIGYTAFLMVVTGPVIVLLLALL